MSAIDQSRLVLNTINKMLFFYLKTERPQNFGCKHFEGNLKDGFKSCLIESIIDQKQFPSHIFKNYRRPVLLLKMGKIGVWKLW